MVQGKYAHELDVHMFETVMGMESKQWDNMHNSMASILRSRKEIRLYETITYIIIDSGNPSYVEEVL